MDGPLAEFELYVGVELGLAKETLAAYLRDVMQFLSLNGGRPFTAKSVEDYVRHLFGLGLKASTVRRKCMSVRCFYRFLVDQGRLDRLELILIDPIRVRRENLPSLEPDELERLLAAASGPNAVRNRAIVHALFGSGLRVSELCGLSLGDCNLEQRWVRVTGKGSKDRGVPLTTDCAGAIAAYLAARGYEGGRRTDPLFIKGDANERLTRRAVSNMITALSQRAGVQHTTSHTLRRTCATSLLRRGVDLGQVQRLLGHSSLSSTQVYLNTSAERLAETCRRYHPRWGDREGPPEKPRRKPPWMVEAAND